MRIANIQINTQNNMRANIKKANELIDIAANKDADLIALPENTSFMASNPKELFDNSYFTEEHPALNSFKEKAYNLKNGY